MELWSYVFALDSETKVEATDPERRARSSGRIPHASATSTIADLRSSHQMATSPCDFKVRIA